MLPKVFHIDLPNDLSKEIATCKTDEAVEEVGKAWLLEQSKDLYKSGVPVLHYYTLGRPNVVCDVVKELI
jgi:methylenetetrahydrofolate reductase (NADPH)